MKLNSYAKINLCLDVTGLAGNGYHNVSMILQQIDLHDIVRVSLITSETDYSVRLSVDNPALPADRTNLAYKAAVLMAELFPQSAAGFVININIIKKIPLAAGLAGGSANCASVIHALNLLWGLGLGLSELCEIGSRLGADVPFCIMGQAAANDLLRRTFAYDPLPCHCALASGIGTDLTPVTGIRSDLVLSKPPLGISAAEAYRGIDSLEISSHPDMDAFIPALASGNLEDIRKNMINVLEEYVLDEYPEVAETKDELLKHSDTGAVMMSGSGPTCFALCRDTAAAEALAQKLASLNQETFVTRTTY